MPLTPKGEKIKANFTKEYGAEKGEGYFYAAKNAGTITGVDQESNMQTRPTGMITGTDPLSGELDCGPPDRMARDSRDQRAELPPGLGLHQAGAEETADQEEEGEEGGEETGDDNMLNPPSLLPAPEFEHPQEHPNESAPPEPAVSGDEAAKLRRTGGYGGIVGGAIEQEWGDQAVPAFTPDRRARDALPSDVPTTATERTYSSPPGLSLAEIQRDGENRYWGFWQGGKPQG